MVEFMVGVGFRDESWDRLTRLESGMVRFRDGFKIGVRDQGRVLKQMIGSGFKVGFWDWGWVSEMRSGWGSG